MKLLQVPGEETKRPGIFYGYIVVAVGAFILFVMGGTFFIYGVFLKPLASEFNWSRAVTSGAYSLSVFVLGLLFMVTGRLTDKFGPRMVVTIFTFILGAGYLLASQISTAWQLYICYGLIIATGQSAGLVPMMSTVARWFVKRRGLMTGIVVSGVGLGSTIMAPVATFLINTSGWRFALIILGIMVWVGTILPAQFLKRDPSKVNQLPDGEFSITARPSVLEMKGFTRREAIRTRQFWTLCLAYFAFGSFVYVMLVHIVPYATDLDISPITASSILAISGAFGTVGRITMGGISDRIGNKNSLIVIFILVIVSLLWLQIATNLWMLNLFAVTYGFAYGGSISLESPTTAELFGLKSHGAILGIIHFSYTTGGAISPIFAGRVFDVTGSYELAFWVFLALAAIAFIPTLFLKKTARGA